jgi:hypothetical protein
MTFVIDPTFYRISPKWKEAYPELINKERFRDVRGFKMSVHSQIREHGMGPDYVMRSHKVVSYITEKSNFTIIGHCNTQIVAKLCNASNRVNSSHHLWVLPKPRVLRQLVPHSKAYTFFILKWP